MSSGTMLIPMTYILCSQYQTSWFKLGIATATDSKAIKLRHDQSYLMQRNTLKCETSSGMGYVLKLDNNTKQNTRQLQLENNDCVTCVFMVLFRNQRLLFWSEEFVPRAQPEGKFRMTKTTTDDFQTKP